MGSRSDVLVVKKYRGSVTPRSHRIGKCLRCLVFPCGIPGKTSRIPTFRSSVRRRKCGRSVRTDGTRCASHQGEKPVNKMMLAVVVLAGACLAKSSQTCAQTTDVQQCTASPSQTGQVMNSRTWTCCGRIFVRRNAIDRRQPETDGGGSHEVLAALRPGRSGIDQHQRQELRSQIWVRDWLDLDTAVPQLRSKYVPIVRGVLPGKKAGTFFPLDRRISMMVDLQISSQIPLVQSQE